MKKAFFSLAIFSILLLIGCQDNSITDPVSSQPLNKTNVNPGNIMKGVIPLDYKLMDPNNKDINYRLSGYIDYTEELLNLGPSETVTTYDVKLDNSVFATLTEISSSDLKFNAWKISSKSDDLVKVTSETSNVLVKSYPVIGMTDRMDLVCTFIVSTDGVKLDSVILETPVVNGGS